MRKYFYLFVLIGLLTLLFSGCEKEENKSTPILSTLQVKEITQTTALSGGNITDDRGAIVTTRGVCWSTGQTPTVNDNKTLDGTGAGDFTSEISGLEPNTTYYVRPYATNSAGTEYGDQIEFKTLENLWKLANEAQFVTISGNSSYQRISSQSGKGYIMYKEIEAGDGETPVFTDKVKVLYTGWYKNDWSMPDKYTDDKGNQITNKIIFDSTGNRNDIPSTFDVNPGATHGVVDGFSTALQHMQVGDKWEIWIPWELAYGANGRSPIPGYTTLVFEVKLVNIVR